jgi:SAM-dependent methyltransferase
MRLEIGCGSHRSPLSDVAIDITRESTCDIVADAHYLPFINKVFNLVEAYEVMEHLNSPMIALKEIHRVLIHTGTLVFTHPNTMHWRAMARWIVKGRITCASDHINAWRLPEIENLLRRTGFSITLIDFVDTHWAGRSIVARVLPRITHQSMIVCAVPRDWKNPKGT